LKGNPSISVNLEEMNLLLGEEHKLVAYEEDPLFKNGLGGEGCEESEIDEEYQPEIISQE
jgi:hypothetical protein